jgi:chemotaxis protein CheZ
MAETAADPRIAALYQDCHDLARYIQRTRSEIATLRPRQLKVEQLPRAGQELDAVVKETEEATHTIMTAAEGLMAWRGGAADLGPSIESACMAIFEACAFQDITGQRVRKVVQTIHHIEQRLERLLALLGTDMPEGADDDVIGDRALLNGPQLAGQGVNQAMVDELLGDAQAKPIGASGAAASKKKHIPPAPAPTVSQNDIDALFD